jgi:hypothetical protein
MSRKGLARARDFTYEAAGAAIFTVIARCAGGRAR